MRALISNMPGKRLNVTIVNSAGGLVSRRRFKHLYSALLFINSKQCLEVAYE